MIADTLESHSITCDDKNNGGLLLCFVRMAMWAEFASTAHAKLRSTQLAMQIFPAADSWVAAKSAFGIGELVLQPYSSDLYKWTGDADAAKAPCKAWFTKDGLACIILENVTFAGKTMHVCVKRQRYSTNAKYPSVLVPFWDLDTTEHKVIANCSLVMDDGAATCGKVLIPHIVNTKKLKKDDKLILFANP